MSGNCISPVTVHQYVSEYELRGDGCDHAPTDGERAMIEDAIEGYLSLLEAPPRTLTEDVLFDILYKHVELDYLHASDGHPDIVGFDKAVAAILALAPAQAPTESECADVVSDLFEARAEAAMYRKLIAEGIQCPFDDAMVTLFVNNDSDPSVGLQGKSYLGLSCNYEVIPGTLLRDIKNSMGDNWERCVASWQEAYASPVSSTDRGGK